MSDLKAILATVDAQYASFAKRLAGHQDAYRAAEGRYWQGLSTADVPPADGKPAMADVGKDTPESTDVPWPDDVLSEPLYAAARCDEYVSPLGAGYVVTLTVAIDGVLWTRVENTGPEDYRTQGWAAVVTPKDAP